MRSPKALRRRQASADLRRSTVPRKLCKWWNPPHRLKPPSRPNSRALCHQCRNFADRSRAQARHRAGDGVDGIRRLERAATGPDIRGKALRRHHRSAIHRDDAGVNPRRQKGLSRSARSSRSRKAARSRACVSMLRRMRSRSSRSPASTRRQSMSTDAKLHWEEICRKGPSAAGTAGHRSPGGSSKCIAMDYPVARHQGHHAESK